MVLVFETEIHSANLCIPLLKGPLNTRKQRCFTKSCIWSCLGVISLFIQRMQPAVGCTPLNKQSRCAVRGIHPRDRGWQFWCAPSLRWLGKRQLPPLQKDSPRPPERAGGRTQRPALCLWRHLAHTDLRAPLATLHLHATALFPRAELLPWKPSSDSGGAWLPALPVFLEMTLLLPCITNETNAPLHNIIAIILQSLLRETEAEQLLRFCHVKGQRTACSWTPRALYLA